jgi:hypothetical protein
MRSLSRRRAIFLPPVIVVVGEVAEEEVAGVAARGEHAIVE